MRNFIYLLPIVVVLAACGHNNDVPVSTVVKVDDNCTLHTPAHPNWSSWPNYSNFYNTPDNSWGTATATNLATAVANTCDVAGGHDSGPANGEVAGRAVTDYRAGKTAPLIRDAGSSDIYPSTGDTGTNTVQ